MEWGNISTVPMRPLRRRDLVALNPFSSEKEVTREKCAPEMDSKTCCVNFALRVTSLQQLNLDHMTTHLSC